jgi:hypothetical protein
MNQIRVFQDEEGEASKTFGNTSKAMMGDNSYRRKDNSSPMKRAFYGRFDDTPVDNRDLSFEQATNAYITPTICPCCRQNLPNDKRNINWNYDKNYLIVPHQMRGGTLSPTTVNFPHQESVEPTTPNPPSKNSYKTEESKRGKKNKRKRKNKGQIKKLEEEFTKNPHWTNEDVERISRDLKLDRSQVYKWNWDQKKKLNILPSKVYVVQVPEDSTFDGKKHGDGMKQVYVKSIQDLIRLKSLTSNKGFIKKEGE